MCGQRLHTTKHWEAEVTGKEEKVLKRRKSAELCLFYIKKIYITQVPVFRPKTLKKYIA